MAKENEPYAVACKWCAGTEWKVYNSLIIVVDTANNSAKVLDEEGYVTKCANPECGRRGRGPTKTLILDHPAYKAVMADQQGDS